MEPHVSFFAVGDNHGNELEWFDSYGVYGQETKH